jgi:PmbA protein
MNLESALKDVVVRLKVQDLDAYEVVGLDEKLVTVEAKQQMVERMQRAHRVGISIRTIKDGRLGFATTKEMSVKSIHQALKNALDSMKNVEPTEDAVLPGAQESRGELEENITKPLGEVSDDERIAVAKSLESVALAAENKVKKVQHPRYEEFDRTLLVMNSGGVKNMSRRQMASCELRVVAEDGAVAESAYDYGYAASFDRLGVDRIARRAARRAVAKLGAKPVPGGRYPVVFTPRAAASMLGLLAPSFFADNVQRGKSILGGKLGEKFYSPSVTIIDDGLLPDGFGSFPFDWEGVPKRRTAMVEDGVVSSWLYDGARAAHDGVESTGNSQRAGLDKLPSVGINNCFLKAGSESRDSIIKGVGRGIVATDLLGLHTANTISGSFSLGLEGFVIEDGAVREPVRGVTVAGNIHDLFKSIAAVGNDLEFFATCGAPTVLVEDLMLGS